MRIQVMAMPGAEGCLDVDALQREVTRRLGRAPTAPDPRAVDVMLRRDQDAWRATIYARERVDGAWQTGVREITPRGGTCPELSQSIALAVTLSIDPDARWTAAPSPAVGTSPGGAPPAVTPPVVTPPAVTPPVVTPPVVTPPVVTPPVVTPPVVPTSPARYPMTVSIDGAAAFGVVHDVSPGVALRLLFATRGRWTGAVRAWWLPSSTTQGGDATLGASLAAGGACARGEPGVFALHACGGLAAGLTHAAALRYEPVAPGDRPWFGAWVGGAVGVVVHPRLSVSLGLDVLAPLYASAYRVDGRPDFVVWQPWAVQGIATLGLDLRLP